MVKAQKTHHTSSSLQIGEYSLNPYRFSDLEKVFTQFESKQFLSYSERKRFQHVNEVLLSLIQEAPKNSFLLPAVVDYIDRINRLEILDERYHLSLFEFWLNHFSTLNEQENYEVRGKIAGKHVPRDEYQTLFPIGMGQTFSGTHFVAAHLSPDVDTMVASFWGWLDAFAARVGNAQHLWSLPGGPPLSPVTHTFGDFFGSSIFANVAHMSGALTLRALDFVTQKGFVKKTGTSSITAFDCNPAEKAIILVDDKGHYLGDWHASDAELVRKIIIRFKSCLRWFENNVHVKLIKLFANKKLHVDDIPPFLSSVFDVLITDCEPAKEFTEKQRKDLNDFFVKVLGLKNGLQSTFGDLNRLLISLNIVELGKFQKELESLPKSDLFDKSGYLKEDRPAIFYHLEKVIHLLDDAIRYIRDYAEQLDVAMYIKSKVLGIQEQYISLRSDVDEMRIKMQRLEYLTVVISEGPGKLFPIGVVWASDLNKQTLGTVTFRDFCNQEEVKMASYLSPISVIDHHKTQLKTSSPPLAIVGDAQSCNVLVAEQAFLINSRYSLGGGTPESIQAQLKTLHQASWSGENVRLMQRLMQRHLAGEMQGKYFVHPHREFSEYVCFLHAILDDTDLLTKVTKRDIDCVVELLNRLKSLIVGKEVEVINLDEIPRDKAFCTAAAKKILKNSEMYSVYQKVYWSREQEIEKNLEQSASQLASLFIDTKEQNGCTRVGQTKLFTINIPTFVKRRPEMLDFWLQNAQSVYSTHPEIDFHLHMVSTIASADEVYEDKVGHYRHQDELWFWIPRAQKAYDHLTSFLTAFFSAHKLQQKSSLEFLSDVPDDIRQIFIRDCVGIEIEKTKKEINLPVTIFRYPAGMLNSRKAMITPYLPRLVP